MKVYIPVLLKWKRDGNEKIARKRKNRSLVKNYFWSEASATWLCFILPLCPECRERFGERSHPASLPADHWIMMLGHCWWKRETFQRNMRCTALVGCLVIENDVHGRGESQMSGKEVHSSSPTPAIPQGVSFPDSRLGAGWGVGLVCPAFPQPLLSCVPSILLLPNTWVRAPSWMWLSLASCCKIM